MQDQIKVKHIEGIMWASDIMSGQKHFPTYNKEDFTLNKEEADDFAQVFKEACAERSRSQT